MAAKKNFPLRIDPQLYGVMEKWAADEFRSVNSHLEYLLREAALRAGRLTAGKAQTGKALANEALASETPAGEAPSGETSADCSRSGARNSRDNEKPSG